mgnify:CR=1 FL=1
MTKVLVITGASKGIGLATVDRFLAEGYRVVNVSRSSCPRDNVTHISADLASGNWAAEINDELATALQGCTTLSVIHNAAMLLKDSVQSVTAADLRRVNELNVVAPIVLNQLLHPWLSAGSSIIYVGSTLGSKAVAGACSYSVSKHALNGLMKATCQDFAGSGVHTAVVCPGFTDTEMLRQHVGGAEEVLTDIASGVTMGRLIQPAEIASTLYFAATNPVINGAELHANLGQVEH